MAWISDHAAQRYVERIAPHLSEAQARAEMLLASETIHLASMFGAPTVKLGNGARLCLRGDCVITVKTSEYQRVSRTILKGWRRAR
jgi:hypothetical protein